MAATAAQIVQALQADNPQPTASATDPNSPFAIVAAEAARIAGEPAPQGLEPLQPAAPALASAPAQVPEWQQAIQALTATVAQLAQAQQAVREQAPAAPQLSPEQQLRQQSAEMRANGLDPTDKSHWLAYLTHKQASEAQSALMQQLEQIRAEMAETRQQARTATYQGTVEQNLAQAVAGRPIPEVTRQHILKDALARVASGADVVEATKQALAPFAPLFAAMPQSTGPSLMPAQIQGTPQQAQQRLGAAAAVAVPGGTHGRQRSLKELSLEDVTKLMAGEIMDTYRRS